MMQRWGQLQLSVQRLLHQALPPACHVFGEAGAAAGCSAPSTDHRRVPSGWQSNLWLPAVAKSHYRMLSLSSGHFAGMRQQHRPILRWAAAQHRFCQQSTPPGLTLRTQPKTAVWMRSAQAPGMAAQQCCVRGSNSKQSCEGSARMRHSSNRRPGNNDRGHGAVVVWEVLSLWTKLS
jgi:hypothetical protein